MAVAESLMVDRPAAVITCICGHVKPIFTELSADSYWITGISLLKAPFYRTTDAVFYEYNLQRGQLLFSFFFRNELFSLIYLELLSDYYLTFLFV